jgi:archaellum biogenesis ATPase FlaH
MFADINTQASILIISSPELWRDLLEKMKAAGYDLPPKFINPPLLADTV